MVYLMVEQQFAKYPWCQRTIRGIFEEVRKRRIHVQEVSELPGGAEERSCVLLVGASEEWINQTAREAGSLGLHPVVLSNRETNSSGLSVSSVKLANLETMFNECDETDFMLLHLLPQELSYSVMAQQCFISETAAKYRVKKMQKLCGAYNREELTELIRNIL